MADDEKSRLYRQIVERTDEDLLLERMRLHGFWPESEEPLADPSEEAAERARIERELSQLRQQHAQVQNPEQALRQERKRRWAESIERRKKRKADRQQERKKRREEYDAHRAQTMVHAGVGVSGGLQDDQSDQRQLIERGLPVMRRAEDLAKLSGLPLPKIRWLTYHRRGAALVHYHRYTIDKKTGGPRHISAPLPTLATLQRWILDNILSKLETTPAAHGFVPTRSILTNASPHVQKRVVLNLDLKDFFPSLTFRRVKGLFGSLGYSEHMATVLGLACTEPPRAPVEFNGKIYHVALGERVLPQGACTSPAITNAVCRRLDSRLAALAAKHQYIYTRYADDLTFSGDNDRAVGRLLRSARSIVESEGFRLHPTKTRIMRSVRRQEVTGVVVNARPTLARREVRTLRAILHNASKQGLESQNRDNHPNFLQHIRGRIAYLCMIDPQKGQPLLEKLESLAVQ